MIDGFLKLARGLPRPTMALLVSGVSTYLVVFGIPAPEWWIAFTASIHTHYFVSRSNDTRPGSRDGGL